MTNLQESVNILDTIGTSLQPDGDSCARTATAARSHRSARRIRGFTLLELMIAVVIVAVLAAIALPSYLGQLRRSSRAEAQALLTDMASRQQQFLADRRAYAASAATLGMSSPASLNGKFNFTVIAANGPPPTYTLTATGIGGQVNDSCPVLSIDSAGNRLPVDCW
jgi:type IV pilus assembly protein PilE